MVKHTGEETTGEEECVCVFFFLCKAEMIDYPSAIVKYFDNEVSSFAQFYEGHNVFF